MKVVTDWLEHTIVGLNLCPWARDVVSGEELKISYSLHRSPLSNQDFFLDQLHSMLEQDQRTKLLVFAQWELEFLEFYDFVQAMHELLEELDLDQELMLLTFHPEFRLAEVEAQSYANWPNSSPFPMIHLLRLADVEAVASEAAGRRISEKNEQTIRQLSEEQRRQHWPWKFRR